MLFRKKLPFNIYGVESQYANKLELTASRFAHFESVPTKHRNYLKDSWSVKIASEVRYWCNRREISEVAAIKQVTAY